MQIQTHKRYDKRWAKLDDKQKERVIVALKLFITNPDEPKLRLHQLKGKYYPQYSISAGGDLRVHFLKSEKSIILMLVGTHSQLYG